MASSTSGDAGARSAVWASCEGSTVCAAWGAKRDSELGARRSGAASTHATPRTPHWQAPRWCGSDKQYFTVKPYKDCTPAAISSTVKPYPRTVDSAHGSVVCAAGADRATGHCALRGSAAAPGPRAQRACRLPSVCRTLSSGGAGAFPVRSFYYMIAKALPGCTLLIFMKNLEVT